MNHCSYISVPLLYLRMRISISQARAILDKAHHTHENLPSELRREGDKKDVDTGSDDGRAQECSGGQP